MLKKSLNLYPQTCIFGLSIPHSWTSLIDIQSPTLGNFEIFVETFNNEVNIVAYNIFFALYKNPFLYNVIFCQMLILFKFLRILLFSFKKYEINTSCLNWMKNRKWKCLEFQLK